MQCGRTPQRIRVEPNHKTFGKLIEAAAKSEQPQEAAVWLHEMLHCSFEPHLLNYNELISAAANEHDLDSAKSWLWHLGEKRLQPNLVSYNSVLNAAAKKGDLNTCTHPACVRQFLVRALSRFFPLTNLLCQGHIQHNAECRRPAECHYFQTPSSVPQHGLSLELLQLAHGSEG